MSDIESRLEQSEISIVTEPAASVEPTGTPQDRAAKHNQKGRELFESGDLEEAISEFKNAIILDPENASYHCNLAIAYDENEQDAEALAEYLKAIALDPNDLQALLSLGYMYSEDDETEKANEVWNRILEIAPASAEAQEVKENMRHQEEL
jgi:Flp pilus assembly protein TadD